MKKRSLSDLNRVDTETFKKQEKNSIIVILDNIRSMHNIGSIFRTADAFAIEKIMLCGITACPPHREIEKTALGATESVDWEYHKETSDAMKLLKEQGYTIYAIEQADSSIFIQDFERKNQEKIAIVFGNEVEGVQQSVIDECTGCIEIPQFGTKHSFNVSVTAGIVLYALVNW